MIKKDFMNGLFKNIKKKTGITGKYFKKTEDFILLEIKVERYLDALLHEDKEFMETFEIFKKMENEK